MSMIGDSTWSRRRFLAAASCAPISLVCRPRDAEASPAAINTVLGKVPAADLGVTLIHEHVLVDFIGAVRVRSSRYDPDDVVGVVLPHLRRIRELGCATLVDCTPAYLGRDARLLRRLSEASGVHLITNTGYYAAGDGKYVPNHARKESAEVLAARWIDEFQRGIDGTDVKPGFIKIGVNKGPLSQLDAKLVRSAALAHKETGMAIACHTGDGSAAIEEVEILRREGVAPSALIWVHAQNGDSDTRAHLARAGVWIEFENANEKTLAQRVEQVKSLQFVGRVLISLDAGWYHVGEPGGGAFRSYDYFFTTLLPALRQAGVSEGGVQLLTVEGPSLALQPLVKRL